MRPGCCWSASALADGEVRDLPELLRAGRPAGPQRHPRHRRRGSSAAAATARSRSRWSSRRGRDGWWALAPRPASGCDRATAVGLAPRASPPTVRPRMTDGGVLLGFELAPARRCWRPSARHGAMPLPPYIRRPRGGDARDRRDYQTVFAAPRRRGRGAHRRAALHARRCWRRSTRAASSRASSPCMSAPAPSRRSRPRTPTSTGCTPEWYEVPADGRRRDQRGARRRRARRRRRHDRAARCSRPPPARTARVAPVAGETAPLHHAGLPLPRRRPAADQLPPAAHRRCSCWSRPSPALERMQAAYAHAIAQRLPLLQLRRRLPARARGRRGRERSASSSWRATARPGAARLDHRASARSRRRPSCRSAPPRPSRR